MFPLHERTRRRICRYVFLTCGLVPMVAVVAWSAAINSGAHLNAVRKRLEAGLGVEVRLTAVSYPRPELMWLEGLELVDRETGEVLLTTQLVEIIENGATRNFIAHQPVVEAASAHRLWQLVQRLLRGGAGDDIKLLQWTASELTLRWTGGSQTLVGCNAETKSGDSGNTLIAVCRTAEMQNADAIKVRIERLSHAALAGTSIEVDAGPTALPCSLLAALGGCENRLGSRATFRGTGQVIQQANGWRGTFVGAFSGVDLHAAISNQFPHKLGGTATVQIKRAEIRNGRFESAEGEIQAGPGIISQSLIASAGECLGMQRMFADSSSSVLAYDNLCAGLSFDDKGLTITGRCGDGRSGAILTGGGAELLHQSPAGPVPIVALVRVLVPDSQLLVPASRQSDWLLRMLPVPDVLARDPKAPPQVRMLDSN